jgi:hypothetical protein
VVLQLTTGGTAQAQMNSVSMKLGETLGMVKAVGTLEKSTELMTMVNELVKVRREPVCCTPLEDYVSTRTSVDLRDCHPA